MNYIASYYKGDNLRKIAVVPLKELTSIDEVDAVFKSNSNAVLFVLPLPPYSDSFSSFIDSLQSFLSEQTLYIPVYFSYESKEINEIISELKTQYKVSDGQQSKTLFDTLGLTKNYLHFSLNIKDPKKHDALHLENFSGFLEVGNANGAPNPVIAIVTYYDSFGVVSDLPSGMNSNGSGIIAMMELIRILSKYYENYENVIKYDILFVMTSAGNLNFEGTKAFLQSLEPSVSENLQYVLCIDSIASLNENDLYLHLSRFPKEHEDTPLKLYTIFNKTSENMDFNLHYLKKKVFLANKVVPWEHEQFSKEKIIAATLSSVKTPFESNFNRTLMTDVALNTTLLKRNIKFIAESILAFLFDYNIDEFAVFQGDDKLIDERNIESSIDYLKKVPRFPLSIEKGSSFNNDIYNFFNTYLQKVKRQPFEYNETKFYDNNSGEIKIYSVKSKMIDLYLLLTIFAYLLVLYVYTKGLKNFIIGVKNAFTSEDE